MSEEKGYLYIAYGNEYIKEAIKSVSSLRYVHPKANVTLLTDQRIKCSAFDQIKIVSMEKHTLEPRYMGKLYKLIGLINSPYQKTFYIDTDTYFCDNCEELFELLDYFDLLLAPAPVDTSLVSINETKLEGYLPYNTGVIVFKKNDKVIDLFYHWKEVFRRMYKEYHFDQPAFMEALLHSSVKIYTLQPIYNLRVPFLVSLPGKKVKIIHGRIDDFNKIEQEVNSSLVHRVWHPSKKRILKREDSLKKKIYNLFPSQFTRLYSKLKKMLVTGINRT